MSFYKKKKDVMLLLPGYFFNHGFKYRPKKNPVLRRDHFILAERERDYSLCS